MTGDGDTLELPASMFDLTDYWNTEEKEEEKTKTCSHSWKEYYGLQEAYEYCEKCDEKRSIE